MMLYLFIVLAVNTLLSFIVAEFARNRKIGHTNTLLLGIFFSFWIALFIMLISPTVVQEHSEPPVVANQTSVAIADKITQLQIKRNRGEITEEDYTQQKNELMKS